MGIIPMDRDNCLHRQGAADLLREAFPHCYSDCAEEEVQTCLSPDRIALIAVESDRVVGFIGAIPQYGVTGWELHPLVVLATCQNTEIGRAHV